MDRITRTDLDRITATASEPLAGYLQVQGRNGYYGLDLYEDDGCMLTTLLVGSKRELYTYLQGMRQAQLLQRVPAQPAPATIADSPNPVTEDLHLVNHGSIGLAHPKTEAGRQWLRDTAPDDAQFHGSALAFEPRYVDGLINAAEADGLKVRL